MTIFYSDEEPLSKDSPVTLHLSPATRILNENAGRVIMLLGFYFTTWILLSVKRPAVSLNLSLQKVEIYYFKLKNVIFNFIDWILKRSWYEADRSLIPWCSWYVH